jgi:beta-lactamase regulating signal transducer with metallopeptidase domain
MQTLLSHLPGLLRVSWQASILIVLVLAAQWVCGRRLQPRWRCALWMLVLLRLGLPWTLPSPASLFNVVKLPATVSFDRTETAPVPMVGAPISNVAGVAVPVPSPGTHWLAWLWLAGALGLAGCAAVNHYRIHRRVTRRRPLLDEQKLNLLEDCKALMGVRTPVTLIETEAIESPALFGFVRPRLLLPDGLASTFTGEELRHVFLHELAHIKRRDVLVGWLMLGIQTVHWFNPLVWLAFYRLRADRELACDALALSCARPGENESYGLTIVKLLEGFGRSVWAPSLAGILENKQQMKERITMIARFHKTNRGRVLAVSLLAGLALVTLTDAQKGGGNAAASDLNNTDAASKSLLMAQQPSKAKAPEADDEWDLQRKLQAAATGNQWAIYELWDTYYRGKHGIQPDPAEAQKWLTQLVQDVWMVKFEPVDDFAPSTPGEFLQRIHRYSSSRSGPTNIGAASFFRTTPQGDKLVGSFLSNYPDELKASLAKVPGIRVISAERITPDKFIKYEQSPQQSLWSLAQKVKSAEGGNQWAMYELWDAFYRGKHGVQPDPAEAQKWLAQLVQDVWVVRFEPVDDFAPTNPGEFLQRIHQYSSSRSGSTSIGAASFFRTTKQGDKLVGSFLSVYPDQLKASLSKVPGLKVTTTDPITPEEFIKYDQSPQESL